MPDPDRASRAMSPYFGGVSREEKRYSCCLDPRIRKDDRGGVLPAVDFFTGGDLSYPLKAVLFFLDSRFRRNDGGERILAFARMTAGEVLPAVDFFTGGDLSYP